MTDDGGTRGKASLVLLALAALGLGALIGVGIATEQEAEVVPITTGDSAATETPAFAAGGAPVFRYFGVDDITVETDEFGRALPTADGENFISRKAEIKTETITFELESDEGVEYKALMKQGDAVTFQWSTDGGQAYYDLHAHDDAFGPEFFSRYEEGESNAQSGLIVAAYDGQHGWYWMNTELEPMKVSLTVAGFYDELIKVEL